MRSTFGGRSPSVATASSTNAFSSLIRSAGLCARSKPIVVEVLLSMARASAERTAEVPRPYLDVVREAEQPLVQRTEDAARPLARIDGEVGPGDIAREERVAAQKRPGLVASRRVMEEERGVLGPMSGRVDGLDLDLAES